MSVRNLFILANCQLISATGSIVIVTLGGIIGMQLADNPAFATLSVSLMVLGVAFMTVPAAMLMRRIGRKAGFSLASISAALAFCLAAYALHEESFVIFVAAASMLGINMAFTQQYRFAATESVDPRYAGRAISVVLLGAIGGAVLGPVLVSSGPSWFLEIPYANTLLAVAALYVVQCLLLLSLAPFRGEGADVVREISRPLGRVARQPVFMVAVISGTAAYGVMSFIMTATPVSMHVVDRFSIEETSMITQSHVLGMYLPSLVSGYLLDRFGTIRVMSAGAMALVSAIAIGWYDHTLMHYWVALVLLGLGWNFLYVGATTMLTLTYRMSERFRAQALNDFCVFSTAGGGSLLAGAVMYYFGWQALVLSPLPILLLVAAGLFLVRGNVLITRHRDRQREEAALTS